MIFKQKHRIEKKYPIKGTRKPINCFQLSLEPSSEHIIRQQQMAAPYNYFSLEIELFFQKIFLS